MQIDETEAIFEVYTDRIIVSMQGDCSESLLQILTIDTNHISEICVCLHAANYNSRCRF